MILFGLSFSFSLEVLFVNNSVIYCSINSLSSSFCILLLTFIKSFVGFLVKRPKKSVFLLNILIVISCLNILFSSKYVLIALYILGKDVSGILLHLLFTF